jgi:EAL domain-containing protein (putative c-di-GMP-specific phosphodiesterase class I)
VTRTADPVDYLRQALEEDAFGLYAQPIGALGKTMSYPMAEVLVRLHEEEQSMLPPGEFFPVLEHFGMMPQLDRWVLRRALGHLAGGSRIPRLCINLSAQTLADRAFPDFFAHELDATRVSGDSLLFDIEETDAVAVPECMARFAATIGSLGSGIVLEGFGRAADSWEPLQAPCVRFVKLSASLTRRLASGDRLDPDTTTLLHALKELGIEIIADFVEDTRVLRRLKARGIRHVQGLGVYRPHPLESFGAAAAPPPHPAPPARPPGAGGGGAPTQAVGL